MTDNLILWELQKIHEALTKTKEELTLNFIMIKSIEKFNFSECIFNTTKLGLIRLSVYNSVFNVNRRNNQFLYAGTVLVGDDDDDALAEPLTLTLTLRLTLARKLKLHLFLIIILKESHCFI